MKKSRWFSPRPSTSLPYLGEERHTLMKNLEETKRELDLAYLGFDQSTDPDLVEFYLFEVDALRARHTYLLRRIKALGAVGESGGVPAPSDQTQASQN